MKSLSDIQTGAVEASVRPAMRGELKSHDEQLCMVCGKYKPRFRGSQMFGAAASKFDRCKDCRGVE